MIILILGPNSEEDQNIKHSLNKLIMIIFLPQRCVLAPFYNNMKTFSYNASLCVTHLQYTFCNEG
jgi:hypothetical protein